MVLAQPCHRRQPRTNHVGQVDIILWGVVSFQRYRDQNAGYLRWFLDANPEFFTVCDVVSMTNRNASSMLESPIPRDKLPFLAWNDILSVA
jgi:hypothetical protein